MLSIVGILLLAVAGWVESSSSVMGWRSKSHFRRPASRALENPDTGLDEGAPRRRVRGC